MNVRSPARAAHAIALLAHLALGVGLVASGGGMGALAALPLLAPLRGLVRASPYTAGWASLLLSFYAGILAAEVWFDPANRAALLLALLAGVEFAALILYVRLAAAERRRTAG